MFNQFPNIPNLNFNFQQQQPRNTITFVRGYEGACNYFIPPNSTVLLMDEMQAQFYIKSIDLNGNTSVKTYRFEEVIPQKTEYVSLEDFNALKAELEQLRGEKNEPIITEQQKLTTD